MPRLLIQAASTVLPEFARTSHSSTQCWLPGMGAVHVLMCLPCTPCGQVLKLALEGGGSEHLVSRQPASS